MDPTVYATVQRKLMAAVKDEIQYLMRMYHVPNAEIAANIIMSHLSTRDYCPGSPGSDRSDLGSGAGSDSEEERERRFDYLVRVHGLTFADAERVVLLGNELRRNSKRMASLPSFGNHRTGSTNSRHQRSGTTHAGLQHASSGSSAGHGRSAASLVQSDHTVAQVDRLCDKLRVLRARSLSMGREWGGGQGMRQSGGREEDGGPGQQQHADAGGTNPSSDPHSGVDSQSCRTSTSSLPQAPSAAPAQAVSQRASRLRGRRAREEEEDGAEREGEETGRSSDGESEEGEGAVVARGVVEAHMLPLGGGGGGPPGHTATGWGAVAVVGSGGSSAPLASAHASSHGGAAKRARLSPGAAAASGGTVQQPGPPLGRGASAAPASAGSSAGKRVRASLTEGLHGLGGEAAEVHTTGVGGEAHGQGEGTSKRRRGPEPGSGSAGLS